MLACSIILDARALGAGLPRQLKALRSLVDRPDELVELLLADDTEDPRLPELARKHDAHIVSTEGTPLGDRLNIAVAHSQGEALLFPAQGVALPASWLVKALADIEHHVLDAVVLTTANTSRLAQFWQRLRRQPPADTLCVSRAWFERVGGCDPSLDRDALPDLVERLRACQARIINVNS